jgi:biopolymer transport protein ExbD
MARKQSRVNNEESEVELDMTPMLDVVFILLIFFIVTSVFVKVPGIEVNRPETETQETEKPTLLVGISDTGEIWVDGREYELAAARLRIEQLREENPRAEAMIQADENAPAGVTLDVMDLLVEMGVPVTVSTEGV